MKTITFKSEINASVEKVWNTLWDKETYGKWTKHFAPGSYYESDWEVNGNTKFMSPNGNSTLATITKLDKPNEVIFSHISEIVNEKEGEGYAESTFEKYQLNELDGITILSVFFDVDDEHEQEMEQGFTKGLEEVKRLAES